MSVISIRGGYPLTGEVAIQGSKNAVLPMIAAAILHKGTTVLTNVPRIQDVFCMLGILDYLGCTCTLQENCLIINSAEITAADIPMEFVKSMRSSIILLGALLGRKGEAKTAYPGGCSIGKRPINLHLYALRRMGAEITDEEDEITATAGHLHGAEIRFDFPSVGATENAVLAAVLADGQTTIYGAAKEPEISELCSFLNQQGAEISGAGTERIRIKGVKELKDVRYRVSGDRIVCGTYLMAGMITQGEIYMTQMNPIHLEPVLDVCRGMGAKIGTGEDWIAAAMSKRPEPADIITAPYPGFPTDLQSPVMSVLSVADGQSSICEKIFEGRYKTAEELKKLGARIDIQSNMAWITGRKKLHGGEVTATDLRGGAALVLAALSTDDPVRILHCEHITRGYEDICRDLRNLGADIAFENRGKEPFSR